MHARTYDILNAGPRNRFQANGKIVSNSGSLVQLHNLIRKSPPGSLDMAVEIIKRYGYEGIVALYGDPMSFSSSMLRPCLVPDEDEELYTADLSQIEARMIAALAGEQPVLDVFASGQDVYCHAATGIFGREITKRDDQERQVGKVSTLSLGFQGGPVAFAAMAKNYSLDIASAYDTVMASATGEQIERANFGWGRYDGPMSHEAYLTADIIKQAWRENNPSIVQYWRDCEDAVIEAVQTRRPVHVGAVTYQVVPISGRDYLWARLPAGRLLCYTDPELRTTPTAWGARRLSVAASSIDSRTKQWTRRQLYGGLLAENCLAGDTEVLTRRGWIHLKNVQANDWLWDGVEWVRHDGLICKGVQPTIDLSGVRLTGDHLVLTTEGWSVASSCEGLDRAEVRTPDLHRLCGIGRQEVQMARSVRLRHGEDIRRFGVEERQDELLRLSSARPGWSAGTDARNESASRLRGLAVHDRSMHSAVASRLEELWRAGYRGLRRVAGQLRGLLEGYGFDVPARAFAGSGGQRRSLLPRQLPLDDARNPAAEPANQYRHRHALGSNDSVGSIGEVRRQGEHPAVPDRAQLSARPFVRRTGLREQVYDLVNAGPRQRFTVRGEDGPFIVHNCTQAAARDVLVAGMFRLRQAGYRIAAHVHDEAIVCIRKGAGDAEQIRQLMIRRDPWVEALGLPVDADVSPALNRYRK